MKEFLGKVPYGWWELFRSRCMAQLGWTYEQWKNRVIERTPLNPAERQVMQQIFEELQKEFTACHRTHAWQDSWRVL